ncbi:MAG: hypothetical protein GY856_44100, partial [bacterium]|nr:hypothetical protein [bacterium]
MSNFTFLTPDDPQLARLAARAELYCHDDPNTALVKLRQFAERLARCAAARVGLAAGPGPELAGLIRELEYRGAISREVA